MSAPGVPQALGYVGVRAKDLSDWASYGSGLLGLQRIDKSRSTLAFRMDDRKQRIIVDADGGEGIGFFGWEVADAAALDALAARLENERVNVAHGARSLADERHVKDLIVLNDPVGNRLEIFHGAETTAEPFKPGRSISGFRTGPLGLGHVVLNVDTAATVDRIVGVLLRHARLPIDGLLLLSLCSALSSHQSAPSQSGLRPERQEHCPSRHDGALQLR